MKKPRPAAEEALRLFLDYLPVEKGLSANTILAYGRDLNKYLSFLRRNRVDWSRTDESTVARFIRDESRAGLQARSLARLISAMKSFYKFMTLDGFVSRDPTANLSSPKTWLSLPKFLTVPEVEALLRQPDEREPGGLRDRAMLEVLYATGLRVSEIINLKPGDINIDEGYVVCRGKGGKERVVPVGATAAAAVRRYRDEVRPGLDRKSSEGAVPDPSRRPVHPAGVLEDAGGARPPGRPLGRGQPARPPAFLRHSPAGAGGGPAFRAAHAGAQPDHDDPDLHPRDPGPAPAGLR